MSKSSLVRKLWYTKHKFFHIWFFASYMKLTKTDESMKRYFQAILWISRDQIIVQAPIIPHFKGLVMRNLEDEKRICQIIHTKVTITLSMLSRFFLNQTLKWNLTPFSADFNRQCKTRFKIWLSLLKITVLQKRIYSNSNCIFILHILEKGNFNCS